MISGKIFRQRVLFFYGDLMTELDLWRLGDFLWLFVSSALFALMWNVLFVKTLCKLKKGKIVLLELVFCWFCVFVAGGPNYHSGVFRSIWQITERSSIYFWIRIWRNSERRIVTKNRQSSRAKDFPDYKRTFELTLTEPTPTFDLISARYCLLLTFPGQRNTVW